MPLGTSRPQVRTHAGMAGEMLKLPKMTNKCTRVRVELWEQTHLKGDLEKEDFTNVTEKN